MGIALKAKIYRNTASHGSPAWSECHLVEGANVNRAYDKGDANYRGSRVKRESNTLLGIEVTFKLKNRPGDGNCDAFEDAFTADSAIDLLILNGDIDQEGVYGFRGDFGVRTFNEDQGIGNVLYYDVTITPADTDNEVVAIRVGGTGGLEEASFGEGF